MGSQDALAAARATLAAAEAAVAENAAAIADTRTELADLQASGAPPGALRGIIRRARELMAERDRLVAAVAAAQAEVERLRDTVGATGPEQLVAGLDGQVPVALLPVRLETRFSPDRRTLWIRVYPDQIHKDDHEPGLTDPELAAGQEYWRARWAAGSDAEQARAAWKRIAAGARPPRARGIVTATTPENVADLGQGEPRFADVERRATPWTRAAQATLLPERWVALGYRGEQEVMRAWGATIAEKVAMGPAPDERDEPPPADGELPIDDGVRWLVDYDEALRMGMAITVGDAEVTGGLARGFDTLVVLGVDWSLDPVAGATALGDRLAGAAGSDGLSFLPAGTATNNTASGGAGAGDDVALLDPFEAPPAAAAGAAGERAERALGLGEGSALATAPGTGDRDDLAARHMANALWPTTWGYFLDQLMRPLVSDAAADAAREHFRDHVRGSGPLPTLRVGDQPYGILPVVAPDAWATDDPIEDRIGAHLRGVRSLWSGAAPLVPSLGDTGAADRDLVKVLRMTPRSASYRVRRVTGPAVVAAAKGLEALAPFQELGARTFLSLASIGGRPRLVDLALDRAHRLLPVPLVADGELSAVDPPEPNYIAQILTALASPGGLFDPRALRPPPRSLLEALLLQSAQIEVADAAAGLIAGFEVAQGTLQSIPPQVQVRERELHGIEAPSAGGTGGSLLDSARGPLDVATLSVPAISGGGTLADHLATLDVDRLRAEPPTARLGEFRASLEHLAGLGAAQLDRLAADTLDCCSHRLDAWLTSLATRRLERVRESVAGTYVGGFGWVEELRPRVGAASFGYVHAPSISHASSAAILRSGHLGRGGDAAGALALDLSSTRVAHALDLLDGMRQGQPIGALLGYRLERGLRDRRIELAGYVLALRQVAPLATAADGFADDEPVEAIAARDVVDGLKLLDVWRADEAAFFGHPGLPAGGADRDDLRAELVALDDLLDAVADLLLAEGVHQMVSGNDERAGAALDALDRQTPLPDVGVARTPRSGVSASHQLLIALHDGTPPAGWASDPRAQAEPRLNAWAAGVLGDPDAVRVEAVARDAAGAELERVRASLPELGLSPLATIMAAGGAGGAERATELESRFGLVLAAKVTADGAAALELLAEPPAGAPAGAIGLGELLTVARELLDLAGACRPASAADLVLDSELRDPAPVDPGHDAPECKRRADAAIAALDAAIADLPAPGSAATQPELAARLLAAADAGVSGAVPAGRDREALLAQTERVRAAGTSMLAAVQAGEAAFDRSAAGAGARVAHDLARLRSVFGESFPAAALFEAANPAALAASLADADALLGDDPLAPATWLAQHALVRPSAARVSTVLSGAEALGRDVGADQLLVAQLPHRPGARWIALSGDRPDASLALVVHSPAGLQPDQPMAAWVVDAWADVVPSASETTGVSFHHDAPGARAPQALLLAVPPSPAATAWSLETLAGSVREALALARMRAVGLDELAAAPRFLPAIYLAFNLEGRTPSIDVGQLLTQAIERDNAAFAQERP